MSGKRTLPSETAAVIGQETSVQGKIRGDEDLLISGRVSGLVSVAEQLTIDENAVVDADVRGRTVDVCGAVVGNIDADESITLRRGCRVVGTLTSPRVLIEEGSAFRGNVEMGDTPVRAHSAVSTSASRFGTAPRRVRSTGSRTVERKAERSATRATPTRSRAARVEQGAAEQEETVEFDSNEQLEPQFEERDVTVVIKHAELNKGERAQVAKAKTPVKAKKVDGKSNVRARVPARGKRKAVQRR